jgi:hypothetical protein
MYLDKPAVGNWPEPLETTWQLLGGEVDLQAWLATQPQLQL